MHPRLKILLGGLRLRVSRFLETRGLYLLKDSEFHRLTPHGLIQQCFEKSESVFFLQIGAHDGKSNDCLAYFRRQPHWKGLLLEPNPAVFPRLQRNLVEAGNPGIRSLQLALSDQDGSLPFYVIDPTARARHRNLPHHMDQWSSLDPAKMEIDLRGHGFIGDTARALIKDIQVEAVSFPTLLDREKITEIDLLFIDAEGMDAVLLRSFPLKQFLPRMVVCEWDKMNNEQLQELLNRFEAVGYGWFFISWDLVLIRKDRLLDKSPQAKTV